MSELLAEKKKRKEWGSSKRWPLFMKYVGYSINFMFVLGSTLMILIYGLQFDQFDVPGQPPRARQWFLSCLYSTITDMMLLEPVKIVLICLFVYYILERRSEFDGISKEVIFILETRGIIDPTIMNDDNDEDYVPEDDLIPKKWWQIWKTSTPQDLPPLIPIPKEELEAKHIFEEEQDDDALEFREPEPEELEEPAQPAEEDRPPPLTPAPAAARPSSSPFARFSRMISRQSSSIPQARGSSFRLGPSTRSLVSLELASPSSPSKPEPAVATPPQDGE